MAYKFGYVPIRLSYTLLVIAAFLMVCAFFWYMLYEVVMPVRWAASQALATLPANNQTDSVFLGADLFMSNVWKFLLVFGVVTLAMWAFSYSQQKGRQI